MAVYGAPLTFLFLSFHSVLRDRVVAARSSAHSCNEANAKTVALEPKFSSLAGTVAASDHHRSASAWSAPRVESSNDAIITIRSTAP